MNIIFRPHFFGGKNNNFDETFVPLAVKSVLQYNPDTVVWFISNEPQFVEKHFSENVPKTLKCFVFDEFENNETKSFNENYEHLSHNPLLFEKFAIGSYIYINNLMKKFNIEEAIIVETDVLVFCNLNSTISSNFNLDEYDAILATSNTICCSYCKKIYFETFVNTTLQLYSDNNILNMLKQIYSTMQYGGICDMTINDWIKNENVYQGLFTNLNSEKKKINIRELSEILQDNSIFDNFLVSLKYKNDFFDSEETNVGVIKKIYNINEKPYFKLKNNFIACNSIHFQGNRKQIMPEIYTTFVKNENN